MTTEQIKQIVDDAQHKSQVQIKLRDLEKKCWISYAQHQYGLTLAEKKFTKEYVQSVHNRIIEQLNSRLK